MKPTSIVLFVSTSLAAACHRPAAPTPQPTSVKTAVVERAASPATDHYSAQIVAATRVDVAFKVGGYIDDVARTAGVDGQPRLLQEGDRVRAGMQLAMIRRADYLQRVAEARASVAQAKAAVEQAELDYGRTARLTERNAVAAAELDAARTKRDGAIAALAGARARLDQASTALSDTSLRSPLDGIVVKRPIELGVLAAPGTVAFSLADVASVKAVFGVPDVALPHVHLGASQTVATEAFPGERFTGRVSLIAPSADPKSRVFEVEITIPNRDGRLKPGLVASLVLDGTGDVTTSNAPLIPLSAVVKSPSHPDKFAVFVVDGRVARARDVELGDYLGKVIPVRSGLRAGETVIVQGAGLVSDGEPVEVLP